MQEVIEELLKVEAEAERKIADAREEVQRIKNQTEADYSIKLSEAREEARRLVLNRVEKTRQDVNAANGKALKKAQTENDARFLEQQPAVERITDEVIDLIMTPEYERDGE